MAFPAGVATAVVTAGSDLSFAGTDIGLTAELEILFGGDVTHIVWEATGQPFDGFLEKLSADPGEALSITLPLVDQTGFIGPSGDSVTYWAYRLTILPRRGLDTTPRVKSFQLVNGDTIVDVDLIPDGPIIGPLSAPNLPVTFPNLIDQINDPDSDISDALGIDAHVADDTNPHQVTAAQVGLSLVNNTADNDKPVSTPQQAALDDKADLVGGIVPVNQLPSYVDDVLEFVNLTAFPAEGDAGKIYVALDTNLTYRWTGSTYGVLDPSIALGESAATAYRGDRGKTAYDHSQSTGNPHTTTAAQVPNTPAGGVAANTVQGAINELDTDKQSVTAMLTKLVALLPAMADGQLIKMDGTLGEPVAMNPVGNSRIAANRNTTGTTTAMSAAIGTGGGVGTTVTIPSTSISVTNSNGRPVVIRAGAAFSQQAVGVCNVQLFLYETTGGTNNLRATGAMGMTGANVPVNIPLEWDELSSGVTTTRTFELRSRIVTSAAAMSGYMNNSLSNPTYIRAIAE